MDDYLQGLKRWKGTDLFFFRKELVGEVEPGQGRDEKILDLLLQGRKSECMNRVSGNDEGNGAKEATNCIDEMGDKIFAEGKGKGNQR